MLTHEAFNLAEVEYKQAVVEYHKDQNYIKLIDRLSDIVTELRLNLKRDLFKSKLGLLPPMNAEANKDKS